MAREHLSEVQRTLCVKDAHGHRVPMLDPSVLHLFRRYHTIPAEPLALMAREIGSGLDAKTRRLLIVLGVIGVFSAVVFEGRAKGDILEWHEAKWHEAKRGISNIL